MRLIIISPRDDLPDEPQMVSHILHRWPVSFHLRKPGKGDDQLADYLGRIPAVLHPRIMIHDHVDLLARFMLAGVHLTEKARMKDPQLVRRFRMELPGRRISSAFHRIVDIPEFDGLLDYLFLSPIFDSISKPGYRAGFEADALRRLLSATGHTVIALGGINRQRIAEATAFGFKGVAALGAVWGAPDPETAAGELWSRCREVSSNQFRGRFLARGDG